MKWEKTAALAAAVVLGVVSQGKASWYGNLGRPLEKGKTAVGAVVDFGSRELDPDGGGDADVDMRGLSFRLTHGMGRGLAVYGQISPKTLTWDFEDSSFEPSLLMLGGGLQWAPEGQTGPVTFGLGLGFDWGQGEDSNTDIDVMEFSLAGGVGYAVDKNLDVYGGLSLLNTDVTLETNGVKSDLNADSPFGLFGGVNFRVAPNMSLGAELRLLNEQVISLMGRFTFGGR